MIRHRYALAGAVAGLALAGASCAALTATQASAAALVPPPATPPGITLAATRGTVNAAGNNIPGPTAYADDLGRLIYVDRDGARASCKADCAAHWHPVAASSGARGFGDWSVVTRADRTRQWSFKGHPLYVAASEPQSADYARCSVWGPDKISPAAEAPAQGRWCVALFEPALALALPNGIGVGDLANVSAQGLVASDGMTLYLLDRRAQRDAEVCRFTSCAKSWRPLPAPEMAHAIGQFSIVERPDRTRQWAFRGEALFTFAGDTAAGDVNGLGADSHAAVAMIARYFTPAEVTIRMTPGFGTVWATSAGMTLYSQNRDGKNRSPSRPNSNLRCDSECQHVWRPLIGSPQAVTCGYWTLVPRPDGTRQWAYRGQLLFSYALDEKPGDLNGEYLYEYVVRDQAGAVIQINNTITPTDRPWFWRPAFPY